MAEEKKVEVAAKAAEVKKEAPAKKTAAKKPAAKKAAPAKKAVNKKEKVCVCQSCGYSWKI